MCGKNFDVEIRCEEMVLTGPRVELTLAPGVLQSKTPPEGTYEGNFLKKKIRWQGTASQSKHALGAFGPRADRCTYGMVALRADKKVEFLWRG